MKSSTAFARAGALLAISALATACGGSSGSTPTDNPPPPPTGAAISAIGAITGFGSIYVNGVEYETGGATYDVDDSVGSDDSALAVGMVVKVQGSVNPDGRTGQANKVSYDDEVEGPVENLATDPGDAAVKTFVVMGVTVRVEQGGTNFDGEDDPSFSFDTIMNGDNVEVSGEFNADVLHATYVEKQDAADDDFEARGTVTAYDGADSFVLVLKNEASLNVALAPGAEIPSVGIEDGQFVEVEGTIPDPVNAPDSLLAMKVELEDDDGIGDDDDDEVEIKGMLSFNADSQTWSVRDVAIAFTASTEYKPVELRDAIADGTAAGLTVEVEGRYVDEVLQVEEIELEEDELEFKGDAVVLEKSGPRDGTLQISFGAASGTVDVVVNADTMFLDDEAMAHFDLDTLSGSNKIEVEARWGDDGLIYVSTLHLENDTDYEITGPVDAIDDVSINILDVVFSIDGGTFFEDGIPTVGDYAEVEDEDADGFADTIEIE